ncbi:MAG: hypothetical protein AAB618_00560 [Patescibacteria group bacterium]
MPDISDTLIKERLLTLTPDYQDFVLGDMPSTTIAIYADLLLLDEDQKGVFANGYTMYLFLFINEFELMEFIATECSVPAYAAVTCVLSILESTPTDIRTSIGTAYKEMSHSIEAMQRNTVLESLTKDELINYIELKVGAVRKARGLGLEEISCITIAEFCGDINLGIYKPTDFIPFLYHNLKISGPYEQNDIESHLYEFIYPDSQAAVLPAFTAQNIFSEISTAENELASLQTVRTMSHDMAAIKPGSDVVYQASSQADILQKEDLIVHAEAVSAAPPSPQWDSETK